MITRICATNNPNFFFLTYNHASLKVENFLLIPKQFFIPEIIEKRKPLSKNARRAGWIGCNIRLENIPELGKIEIVKNSQEVIKSMVQDKWQKTLFLRNSLEESKGWLIDVLNCIEKVNQLNFTLKDIYIFENKLKKKYPNNSFIKEKIRQQMQVLRDKGIIEFKGNGNYKKIY